MTKKINFTQTLLSTFPPPKKGTRTYYYDSKVPGLGIMIFPSGTKTFFLYKRIHDKPVKVKLGRFQEISVEQARNLAFRNLNDIANGIDPNEEKKKLRNQSTFKELAERFINEYSKHRKKSWKNDLGYYTNHLKLLDRKNLSSITPTFLEKLHNNIKTDKGLYAANRVLALLKTMFNKAIDWGYSGSNPTSKIKKFAEKTRDRAIQPHELKKFFESLKRESNIFFKAYIYMSLLTGARRQNVLSMRWQDINFGDCEWIIKDTKNGEPHTVSLVPQAIDTLKELEKYSGCEWVFPSHTSKSGHLEEPKKAWKRLLERADISDLRIHDLRRTMASWQVRTGANSFIISKTLGHKTQQATAIYARVSRDVARESMENAVNAMFKYN